jgi:RNA polymerase primary sigma factor
MAKKKAQAMTFEDLKDLIKENAKIRGGQLTQDDLDAFLDKYELDDETSEELLSFISDNDLLSEDDLDIDEDDIISGGDDDLAGLEGLSLDLG